jgi:hypothetical protein
MLEEQWSESVPEADTIHSEERVQEITYDGRIRVSTKAWILRIIALTGIGVTLMLNLYQGLKLGDPLVVYSTLMPTHELAVFAIGWLFYRCRASGPVTNELVSVIIPIFNQIEMIETVIDAIYKSTYEHIEVIAVNDGSIDGTKEILDELAYMHPNLRVIHKENEGKRKAVATGFYASKGQYIVLIDSDSVIEKKAIEEIIKTFSENPKIGGVVGNGKVWNANTNFLTKCQDVWYDYAYNIHKTTESTFGCVLCCSGNILCIGNTMGETRVSPIKTETHGIDGPIRRCRGPGSHRSDISGVGDRLCPFSRCIHRGPGESWKVLTTANPLEKRIRTLQLLC